MRRVLLVSHAKDADAAVVREVFCHRYAGPYFRTRKPGGRADRKGIFERESKGPG